MHILLVIILLLLLIVLVPLLFVGLAAYAKLRSLWYKLTGRPAVSTPEAVHAETPHKATDSKLHRQALQAMARRYSLPTKVSM